MPISRRAIFARLGAIAAAGSIPGCIAVAPAAASISKAAPYLPGATLAYRLRRRLVALRALLTKAARS